VAPIRLRARHLLIPEANVRIPTPNGDGWVWYEGKHTEHVWSFVCRDESGNTNLIVTGTDFPTTAVSANMREQVLGGIREQARTMGLTFRLVSSEAVDAGVGHALRLRSELSSPTAVKYSYIYVVPTGRSCTLTMFSDGVEPGPLRNAVAGLQIIKPVELIDLFPTAEALLTPATYVVFGGLAFGIGALVVRTRRGRGSPWTAVLVVMVILSGLVVIALRRLDFEDISARDRNRMISRSLAWPTLEAIPKPTRALLRITAHVETDPRTA
jgi:hypothetical protein